MVSRVNKLVSNVNKVNTSFSVVGRVQELDSNVTMGPCNISLVSMINMVIKLVFEVRKVKTIISIAIIVNAMVCNVTGGCRD